MDCYDDIDTGTRKQFGTSDCFSSLEGAGGTDAVLAGIGGEEP